MSGRSRWRRHFLLGTVNALGLLAAYVAGDAEQAPDRLSIVSAYLCLGLLCVALLIGPAHAMRTGRPLLNDLGRRDIGIWAALVGLLHFSLAMVLSMNYQYMDAFVYAAGLSLTEPLRYRLYSWGNISGFLVGVLFLLLLTLSNNRAISLLSAKWWKRLQRTSYLVLAATVVHAFSFQALESRSWPLVLVVGAGGLWVLVQQIRGNRSVRVRSLSDRAGAG